MNAYRNHKDDEAHEQVRQQQQSAARISHDIGDEIAKTVEARLVAKAATYLLLNAAALIAAIATGIGAYYALDKRTSLQESRIDMNSARIERLITEDATIRNELRDNQNIIIQQNNNLAAYLKQHDSNQTRESAYRSQR